MPAAISVDELTQENSLQGDAGFAVALEAAFNRITRLAAQIFVAPFSAITLIDSEGRHSFDDRAFSACAMSHKEPLVVLDPLGDPRFRNHPLVTGNSAIRFYIAAPLVSRTGRLLGTLSVADTKVRLYVLPAQRAALKDLAAIAVFELEQRGR